MTHTIKVAINNGIYPLFSGQQAPGSASAAGNQLGILATLESQCPAARCLWEVIPHCPKF